MNLTIRNLGNKTIPIVDSTRPLLFQIQEEGLDWMHACGGKGRCTTCKVLILEGGRNLSDYTASELKYLQGGGLLKDERLACQAKPLGDVVIYVPASVQLPHLKYT
jgi:2Fe-2S ferredoxin